MREENQRSISCSSSTKIRRQHIVEFVQLMELAHSNSILTLSDGFYTERAERSLQAPLQKCRKAAPPKKGREASTTVVLNQGSVDVIRYFDILRINTF